MLKEAEVQSPKKFNATATLDGQSNVISGFDTAFCRGMLPVSLAKKKLCNTFLTNRLKLGNKNEMISVARRFRCLLHEILAACCESSY